MTPPEPASVRAAAVTRAPDPEPPHAVTRAPDPEPPHAVRAGLVAGAAYVLVGWRALLVPSLIRFVAPTFGQTDAGLGTYYLVTAVAYGLGALSGGRLIRRFGAKRILPAAALLMAGGLVLQGSTGEWLVFALAGIVVGLGAASADVGIQALFLDLFPHVRGRALNLLHVAYGAGALLAPLLLAALVGLGIDWQWLMTGSGLVVAAAAVAMALTVPSNPGAGLAEGELGARDSVGRTRRLPIWFLVMAVSITCYVASEAGVSNWLVRYLEALPITQASLALTLFWAGIAGGRLVFARIGNRLDPQASASMLAISGGGLLALALLVPVGDLTPFLFGAVGIAFGPVFPLVVAAAGARLPGESAMVTGTLVFSAVIGGVLYPPAIGFLSGVIGLPSAMLGTALLAAGCGAAVWISRGIRT